jgi:hypothetical protein
VGLDDSATRIAGTLPLTPPSTHAAPRPRALAVTDTRSHGVGVAPPCDLRSRAKSAQMPSSVALLIGTDDLRWPRDALPLVVPRYGTDPPACAGAHELQRLHAAPDEGSAIKRAGL